MQLSSKLLLKFYYSRSFAPRFAISYLKCFDLGLRIAQLYSPNEAVMLKHQKKFDYMTITIQWWNPKTCMPSFEPQPTWLERLAKTQIWLILWHGQVLLRLPLADVQHFPKTFEASTRSAVIFTNDRLGKASGPINNCPLSCFNQSVQKVFIPGHVK